MKNINTVVLLAAILFLTLAPISKCLSQNRSTPAALTKESSNATHNNSPKDEQISEMRIENQLLKARNESLEQSQANLLSTVHWSLGGIFTMALALAGFSWLNNNKLYDADKVRTRSDLESYITRQMGEIQSKEQEIRVNFLASIENRIEGIENRTSSNLIEATKSIESTKEKTNELSKIISNLEDKIKTVSSNNQKNYSKAISVSREIEEKVWEIKNIPTNILITQNQSILACVAAGDKSGATLAISRMKATIKKYFPAGGDKISKDLSSHLEKRLSKASDMLPAETAEVIELLKLSTA